MGLILGDSDRSVLSSKLNAKGDHCPWRGKAGNERRWSSVRWRWWLYRRRFQRYRAQLKKPDQYLLSEHHVSDLRTQQLTCSRSCYNYSLCSWWLNLLVLPETWRFMFCMWHAFWNCPLAPKNVFSKGDYLYTYTFVHSFSPKCTSTKTRCIFYTEIIV